MADKTDIVLLTADRDATVEIVGDFDENYNVVKTMTGCEWTPPAL